MELGEDRQIRKSIPFLRKKTVLFVDSSNGPFYYLSDYNLEDIRYMSRETGYSFIYLPEICKYLTSRFVQYQFPGLEGVVSPEAMYQQIRTIANLNGQAGFLYKANRRIYFHAIEADTERDLMEATDQFFHALYHRQQEESREIRLRKSSKKGSSSILYSSFDIKCPEPSSQEVLQESNADLPRTLFDAIDEETAYPDVEDIIDAWDRFERQYHISIKDLATLLGYRTKLSRLYITASNQIFLTDWEGRPEVKLDDLTKALYFFYLRNPEGAAFKDLPDHEEEVLQIYLNITSRDDIQGIRSSVSALCASYSSGRDSCVSRIRTAFRRIVGDEIAKKYYIDGPQGGVRKVAIDRDLVIWEH